MEIPGISEEAEVLFWYELRLKQYPSRFIATNCIRKLHKTIIGVKYRILSKINHET